MPYSREPRVHPVPMTALRPTQITVGMREVKTKRKAWREHPDRKKADFLGKHMIPVVWGPKEEFYVVDHHHLSLALHQEGVKEVATTVMADLRRLPRDAFWIYLDNRGWLHLSTRTDAGVLTQIFRAVSGILPMTLTGALQENCAAPVAFAKDTTPFSEFLWADFLRRRLKPKLLEADFPQALVRALKLAKSPEADFLPGWCGPIVG